MHTGLLQPPQPHSPTSSPSASMAYYCYSPPPTHTHAYKSGLITSSPSASQDLVLLQPPPHTHTHTCKNGLITGSPSASMAWKLPAIMRLMRSAGGESPCRTDMAFCIIHAADRPGLYACTRPRLDRSRLPEPRASSTAETRRRRWRSRAPKPPNESGDWIPLASPTCSTLRGKGGQGGGGTADWVKYRGVLQPLTTALSLNEPSTLAYKTYTYCTYSDTGTQILRYWYQITRYRIILCISAVASKPVLITILLLTDINIY